MSVKRRIHHFLVHLETGQRYPVSEAELVIGRTSGDLVFPDDFKLSKQHCRILRTPKGLGIQDMGSANSTLLDGEALDSDKVYLLRSGSTLTVGAQSFRLHTPTFKKRRKRRHQRRRLDLSSFYAIGLIVLCACGIALIVLGRKTGLNLRSDVQVVSPYVMVEEEIRITFADYARLGREHQAGRLSNSEMAHEIRRVLIPAFTTAHSKLTVLRPGSEWERHRLEIHRQLVAALLKQVTVYADFLERGEAGLERELESHTKNVDRLHGELQKLKRRPASSAP